MNTIYFCGECQMYFKSEVPVIACSECGRGGSITGPMSGDEYLSHVPKPKQSRIEALNELTRLEFEEGIYGRVPEEGK
jgi:hypothetical protein